MITETQNHTPEFTVEAGRQILRYGKPCIAIQRTGCEPVYADDITHRIAALLNSDEAMLAENARLLKEAEAADGIFCAASRAVNELKAENARLRDALKRAAQSLVHDSLMLRRAAAQSAQSALAGERSGNKNETTQ